MAGIPRRLTTAVLLLHYGGFPCDVAAVRAFAEERGLIVIRALSSREPQTLSEVARATGLTRSAVRRFLITLEQLGYVRQSDGRFAPYEVGSTLGVVDARVMDWNGDGRPDLLVVEPSKLSWWENASGMSPR